MPKKNLVKKNLNFLPLEYKDLSQLDNKFDLIFTLFGIEDVPKDKKLDKFEIRDNKDYQAKYDYFNDFFAPKGAKAGGAFVKQKTIKFFLTACSA